MLRTIVAVSTAVADTAVLGPAIMASSLVSEDLTEKLSRAWCTTVLAGMGVEREVSGLENIEPGRTYVFVCNHQSHVDPPTCFASLPGHLRFVAKESLFRIPVFGWSLRRAGHIAIDRSDRESSTAKMNANLDALRTRVSIVLFPEGTRSDDGKLGPFKKGAAVMAIQAQVPVMPMAISGTRFILPKGFNAIHSGKVRLKVGKPIPTNGLTLDDRESLTNRMRDEVAKLMTELD
jgi:1-acyl-sn-glycerol-3-phosphate acyltransferase